MGKFFSWGVGGEDLVRGNLVGAYPGGAVLVRGLLFGVAPFGLPSCTEFDPVAHEMSRGNENLDVGGEVEVFSWWTSGGEQEALEALLREHRERVPDARVTNAAVEFADKAREQLGTRLSTGNPPDLFQANSGTDLFTWVETNGYDDSASVVESVSDLSSALKWDEVFDRDVLDSLTYDGRLYGVPANVHRINTLYYRKDLFEEFSLEVPETLPELLALCERIMEDDEIQERSPDGRMACLGLGNKWDWTFSLVTFEMIFPAIAGPDFYESYFLGFESALPVDIEETLATALTMYCGGAESDCLRHSWFNSDIQERTWDEGVRKLSEGKALMAPMGDWAKGYLESEEGGALTPGEEFDSIPFPGTKGTFVFTADSFTMPRGAKNRDGARSLLRTVASREGQIAFNMKKGSIPARVDIPSDNFDRMQQATMRAFDSARKVRALSGLVPSNSRDLLHPELSASLREESTERISRFLRASYPFD
jgi:glucose/mannose transport system substrate-binding protein